MDSVAGAGRMDLLAPPEMNHAALVERAARWLANTERCVFVVTELSIYAETPDAIGWSPNGRSILVECKANRSDFNADKAKPWRRHPEDGMGTMRYYMTPPDLVTPDQLPHGWGLLEVHGRSVRKVAEAATQVRSTLGHRREIALLLNAVRRCHGDPRLQGTMRPVRHIEPLTPPTEEPR